MNILNIIDSIKKEIQPLMDKWVDDQCDKIQILKDIQKSDDYKNYTDEKLSSMGYTSYDIRQSYLYMLGYTKQEIQDSKSYSEARIKDNYIKISKHKLSKIDVAVNKKLKNLDICNIKRLSIVQGLDGYIEGSWIITTTDTVYKFSFETIYAGGYNIQCLHIRTKFKLSEIKDHSIELLRIK